jgi:hypothetical protein
MPYKDTSCECEALRLKSVLVSIIKNLHIKHNKTTYEATIKENKFAKKLYEDFNGMVGIEPTPGTYATADYILTNKRLGFKCNAELKCRNIDDIYKSLVISKIKICNILGNELYPTYICMDFGSECYVYRIGGEEDIFTLKAYHERWDQNEDYYFIPKDLCMNYNQFINSINAQLRYMALQYSLNQQDIIP